MDRARLFRLLGHPFRLAVLDALAREDVSAGALARRGGVRASAASNDLNRLEEAGLVERRREGRRVVYALRHPELTRFLKRADVLVALADASARPRRRGRRPRAPR